MKESEEELRRIDEDLLRYQETREEVGRLKKSHDEHTALKQQRADKGTTRLALVKDLWRDVMAPRLQQETARLEQERDQLTAEVTQLVHLERQKGKLSEDLTRDTCSQCGRGLEESERARIRSELKRLEAEIVELSKTADADRARTLTGVLSQLRKVAPAGITSALQEVERDLRRLDLAIYKAEEDIKGSERKLRGVNTEQVLEWDRAKTQLDERLNELRAELRQLEVELEAALTNVAAEKKKLLDNENPESQHLAREHDTLEVLEDLAGRAVGELTDELRVEVEEKATEIFLELTTDKTFRGLRINDRYGLTIVQADGADLRVRSAGAEQVVALSLLRALNRLATKRGPVIMDTPFGRLDRRHRGNILKFLPGMADQVVLLIHDGEVDTERDLDPVRDQISERYRIVRDAASKRSALEVVRSEVGV